MTTPTTDLADGTPTTAGPMPGRTLIFAGLLVAVGVAGFALSPTRSPTSLIPAAVGVLLGLCGGLALAKPGLTKHAMHAAAVVGLLGLLASAGRLGSVLAKGTVPDALAFGSLVAMATLCAAFVLTCVLWFVGNRRARRAAGACGGKPRPHATTASPSDASSASARSLRIRRDRWYANADPSTPAEA